MVPESVRIKFRKTGKLKYISHLDLCRTMSPAMIRANIPLWYTEGFNPHPKMVFAQPLPLFVESECEFLDIKITEHIEKDELIKRLRSAFTDELYVTDVYTPETKFTSIGYAVYRVKSDKEIGENEIESFLSPDEVKAVKKTKDGEKTLNIKNQIRSVTSEDKNTVIAVLDASAEGYLNPELFASALLGEGGYSVTRTGWLDRDGKEFF